MDDPARERAQIAVDAMLLEEARALGIDPAHAAEAVIAAALKAEREHRWKEENAAAIAEYNAFIEANGIPFSEFRKF